ncbi:MAG: BON domain-containing protein [Bacillota bacterium]|nr:BON domain-containing protein [Bacillota bacterium]
MQQEKTTTARIIEAISSVLETEALDVNVDVYENRIVLSGFVDVLQDKIAVAEAVEQVAGALTIENNLTVSTDGAITDQQILEAVERKLVQTKLRVPGIEVRSGRVKLKGRVENLAELGRIVERASEVLGVAEVDTTQLRVEGNTDDATLKNRIEVALVNITSAPDVDTAVDSGKVELRGYVASRAHAREVSKAVESIDGVHRLDNNLQVRNNQADK